MFTLVNVAITFTTNIIIILGDNVSITSMDEGLTQRGRGSRGRGTRRGRGTVARERDVHSGKYSYNIYYKFIIIILGDNVSITSMDEGLTTQRDRGSRGRGTRGGRGRGTVARERDVHSGKYSYNIYYKYYYHFRRQCFYYKYG